MPFKSKAQMRKFFAMESRGELPEGKAREWAHETKSISKLPEHKRKGSEKKAMEKRGMFFDDRNMNAVKDGMFFKHAADEVKPPKQKDIELPKGLDPAKGAKPPVSSEKAPPPLTPPKPPEADPFKGEESALKPKMDDGSSSLRASAAKPGQPKVATDQSNAKVEPLPTDYPKTKATKTPKLRAGDEQKPDSTEPGLKPRQEGQRPVMLSQAPAGKKTFTPPEKVAEDRASQMASMEQANPAGSVDRSSGMPMFGTGLPLKKKTVKQAAENPWHDIPGKGREALESVGEGAGRAATGALDYVKGLPDWAKAALVGIAGYKGLKGLGRIAKGLKGKVVPEKPGLISKLLGK